MIVSLGKGKELNIPKVWADLKQKVPASFSGEAYTPGYKEEDFKKVASLLKIQETDAKTLMETPSVGQHDIHADHT